MNLAPLNSEQQKIKDEFTYFALYELERRMEQKFILHIVYYYYIYNGITLKARNLEASFFDTLVEIACHVGI